MSTWPPHPSRCASSRLASTCRATFTSPWESTTTPEVPRRAASSCRCPAPRIHLLPTLFKLWPFHRWQYSPWKHTCLLLLNHSTSSCLRQEVSFNRHLFLTTIPSRPVASTNRSSHPTPLWPAPPHRFTTLSKVNKEIQIKCRSSGSIRPLHPVRLDLSKFSTKVSYLFKEIPVGFPRLPAIICIIHIPAGGIGQPVMPSNQAALPAQAQSAAPRCVVPLVRPPTVHISKIQGQPRRSPSPKSVQFPSPAAPCKTFDQHGRPPPSRSTVEGNLERLGGLESTMTRPHVPSYARPTVLHQSQLAVRYRQPNIISTGELFLLTQVSCFD